MQGEQYLLTGRRILVTGASSGIGRSTAIILSKLGAAITAIGRDSLRLAETMSQLSGDEHFSATWDLEDTDAIPQRLKQLAEQSGPLSGVVHSAGVQFTKPIQLFRKTDFNKCMTVNVEAALALTRGYRQCGVNDRGGSLVLISSVMAHAGQPGLSIYSASKGALSSTTRSLAMELSRENIRVNCVAPGVVETEMTAALRDALPAEAMNAIESRHPLGIGTPDDIANACGFLLSPAARWITGTTLVVDGGYLSD